jgi:hypothetical protein
LLGGCGDFRKDTHDLIPRVCILLSCIVLSSYASGFVMASPGILLDWDEKCRGCSSQITSFNLCISGP